MLRAAKNEVKIEGILSEIDLTETSYVKKKTGEETECIRGQIKIRVEQMINKVNTILEIPVHLFADKYYYVDGKKVSNSAYESIKRIKDEFISIAAVGDEDKADCVRITKGSIVENSFYNPNGMLVTYPRINATYVNKVKRSEFSPQTRFNIEFYIQSMGYELDREGLETDKYVIKGVVPNYKGEANVINFYAYSKNVIDVVSMAWREGKTVNGAGILNFSSKTETIKKDLGFGDPIEETHTIKLSELILTGGNPQPLEGPLEYEMPEVQASLVTRQTALEKNKERDMSRAKTKQTPSQDNVEVNSFNSLGF